MKHTVMMEIKRSTAVGALQKMFCFSTSVTFENTDFYCSGVKSCKVHSIITIQPGIFRANGVTLRILRFVVSSPQNQTSMGGIRYYVVIINLNVWCLEMKH